MAGINTLPNEIIQQVCHEIDDYRTLSDLAKTNHRFYAIANPILYAASAGDGERSALLWAADSGVVGTLEKALDAGADPDEIFYFNVAHPDSRRSAGEGPSPEGSGDEAEANSDFSDEVSDDVASPISDVSDNFQEPLLYFSSLPGRYWWSALHIAACKGYAEIVYLLLDHGASMDQGSRGLCGCRAIENYEPSSRLLWTPLHTAICHRRPGIAKLLLERGADTVVDVGWRAGKERRVTALHTAAATGDVDMTEYLLKSGIISDVDVLDLKDYSPFGYAYKASRWDSTIPCLHQHGANVDTLLNGATALTHACMGGSWAAADKLIEYGANVHADHLGQREGPLRFCCRLSSSWNAGDAGGALNVLKRIIAAGADLEVEDEFGNTPLVGAARCCGLPAVSILLAAGANVLGSTGGQMPPLIAACGVGGRRAVDVVSCLLDHGAPVNQEARDGMTALARACSAYRPGQEGPDVIETLLSRGANPDCLVQEVTGSTPSRVPLLLHLFLSARFETCDILLEHGADLSTAVFQGMCESAYKRKWSRAFEYAMGLKKPDMDPPKLEGLEEFVIGEIRRDWPGFLQVLFRYGMLPMDLGSSKSTIHYICDNHPGPAVLKMMIDGGVDANIQLPSGVTPLHVAIRWSHHKQIRTLLEAGADLCIQHPKVAPPLKYAIDHALHGLWTKEELRETLSYRRPGPAESQYACFHTAYVGLSTKDQWNGAEGVTAALLDAGMNPNATAEATGGNALASLLGAVLTRPSTTADQYGLFVKMLVSLLAFGADVGSRDKQDTSALDYLSRLAQKRDQGGSIDVETKSELKPLQVDKTGRVRLSWDFSPPRWDFRDKSCRLRAFLDDPQNRF